MTPNRRAVARIDVGAIERNAARLPKPLCAVVKANGYGHGAAPAAEAALAGGATWLAVAAADEAAELRALGFDGRVLVMGALTRDELRTAVDADADVVAWSDEIAEAAPRVHVKLDTGMGRLGTRDRELALRLAARPNTVGVMTHFATADERGDDFFPAQLEAFREFVDEVGRDDLVAHAANSAATLREPAAHFDMVRCGVALYGMDPFQADPGDHGLEPALSLHSWVASVRRLDAGESAGYGRVWRADEPTWVATAPIGYGDGWRRALTNNADVLIRGRRHPVVGAVSMDNVAVALGPDTDVELGDEIVLIGRQGDERILAEEVARRLGTINYDVTAGLLPRVRRERVRVSRTWTVGGRAARRAARPRGHRHRLRGGRRPGASGPRACRRAARPGVPALGGLRRMAGRRPADRPGVRLRAAPGPDDRGRPAKRDFTVNAMARPREGGELIDPLGGRADLESRTLRVIGPEAYEDDPLRPLRLARFAAELGFEPDPETERLTATAAPRVAEASGERVFAELRRLVLAPGAVDGLALADRLGLLDAVLPELSALHDVEQSHFHHKDVYGHTLEVLERLIEVECEATGELREVLDEPLADELTRGEALRFGALLHDIGKPATHDVREDGRVTFIGHDRLGEEMVRQVCRRLRTSERLSRFLQARDAPPSRARLPRARAPARPPGRLPLPQAHLAGGGGGDAAVLRRPARHARAERRAGDRRPPRARPRADARGARLAPRPARRGCRCVATSWRNELGIEPGPELGRLIAELEEAAYAGEVTDRDQAVELARRLRDNAVR